MDLTVKHFRDLSTSQLYEILRLRSEVFIVEQQGCYQDLDGIDCRSLHIFLPDEDGSVLGCVRIFPAEGRPGTVQIGRLVVRNRRTGLGTRLMEEAARQAELRYGARDLYLTGRRSAREFYEACGYTAHLPDCYQTEDEALYFEFTRSVRQ